MTKSKSPEIGLYCAHCSHYTRHLLSNLEADTACPGCGKAFQLQSSLSVLEGGRLNQCPGCGNRELYVRKDFPQQLGCFIVLATIVISSIAYALWDFPAALLALVVATLIDIILYNQLGNVAVCYRCHCEMRGFPQNPSHKPFDIHRAEEYEQGR